MERLISMTDFVLQEVKPENLEKCEFENAFTKIYRYAEFIKQKLELWMFVPCKLVDGAWVVLEEPDRKNQKYRMIFGEEKEDILDLHSFDLDLKEYQEAKDRVLFEGWKLMQIIGDSVVLFNDKSDIIEFINGTVSIFDKYKADTIESLSFYSEKENILIELTPTAKKQIGL